ncbi:class I SAM-dependent methyltransferase [Spirosoma flavus]
MNALYSVTHIPIFQNKLYPSFQDAVQSTTGDVELVIDPDSGLVKNRYFDPQLMEYDENYQNEQNYSPYFQHYLEEVSDTVESFINHNKSLNIIEIGCGKGYFLEHLRRKGYYVTGYDPTYEGDADYIVKDYFGQNNEKTNGDMLILRHTMEHIPNPFSFLRTIAEANGHRGKIFIEVPTLDWIADNNAFWDVFYEHCNYFTESSFGNLFSTAQTGRLFNGQYMYLFADLADLKSTIDEHVIDKDKLMLDFSGTLEKWTKWLEQYHQEGIAVWGAGAKGSTFVNRLDREVTLVKCLVDISPRKYGRYVAGTGHPVLSPDAFRTRTDVRHILVMNPNYLDEIKAQFAPGTYNILPLE